MVEELYTVSSIIVPCYFSEAFFLQWLRSSTLLLV